MTETVKQVDETTTIDEAQDIAAPKRVDFWLIAKGFAMGAADVVPGVSGGTMAFILGIYERLIAAVRSFDMDVLKLLFAGQPVCAIKRPHWLFIAPLMLGIVMAFAFFTKVVPLPELVETERERVFGFFFGLIAGSIIVLMRHIPDLQPQDGIFTALGAGIGYLLVTLVPVSTPDATWFIVLSGMLAISAMLLPGVSGSFILLILGKYTTILGAVGDFNLKILIPFACGCGLGLIVFSRGISWLLTRFHRATVLVITGILTGSLYGIWPFQSGGVIEIAGKVKQVPGRPMWPETMGEDVYISYGLMVAGFVLVLAVDGLGRRAQGGQQHS